MKVQMNICNGQKSQGALGTRTRVHQGTDGHLQRRKVSRYTRYRRDEGTQGTDEHLQRTKVSRYTRYRMDICKGEKSQGTLGTEGTRVHQGTDEHLQRRKVSRYTRYRMDEGTPRYR